MAAGVALGRGSVSLLWISLGCFVCFYWAAGVNEFGDGFFDDNTTNETVINCPNVTDQNCSDLNAECLVCAFNTDENFTCVYGINVTVECCPLSHIVCRVSVAYSSMRRP